MSRSRDRDEPTGSKGKAIAEQMAGNGEIHAEPQGVEDLCRSFSETKVTEKKPFVRPSTTDSVFCPCNRSVCSCRGYARHPEHSKQQAFACFEYSCKVHFQWKITHGVEPQAARWQRRPNWTRKPETLNFASRGGKG